MLVSGVSFALTQFVSSNFLGPELPDILSALVSLFALAIFLKFWKPKTTFRFQSEKAAHEVASASAEPRETQDQPAFTGLKLQRHGHLFNFNDLYFYMGNSQIKTALTGHYEGANAFLSAINSIGHYLTFMPEVPWLNNLILNGNGEPIAAVYKLELLGAAGTAILLSAVVTKFIVNISWKDWFITFNETCKELALPLLTIMSVVAFAYVTNASGMSTTLGLLLAKTGALFPFFSPVLGWLGVFITGSDTSANLLFGNLQKSRLHLLEWIRFLRLQQTLLVE
ncbi:L-lactate permease [Priestia megaterium]